MLDPLARWRRYGEKPDFAGLLTYGGQPYTEDPAELAGADVAIVGAPTDDLVSDRPGTRYGPRAIRAASCPPGPHLETGVDALEELRVVDFGDAPVLPADAVASQKAIEETVAQVVSAGVIPVILGGDHSITEPDVRACAAGGPVGLVHFDTHTDTGTEVFGVELSHGTPMYKLVEAGLVDPQRYVQIGLRGYWPGEKEFSWQRERGIRSFFMHDVRERGIRAVVEDALGGLGPGPCLPHRGHRRPRPRLRARHGDARARRDDHRRSSLGLPGDRLAHRARRRGCRRSDPDGGRLRGHHGARGRPDRPRDPHRSRARPEGR